MERHTESWKARQQGQALLSAMRRKIVNRIIGPDPESKRQLSNLLATLGAAFIVIDLMPGSADWFGPAGGGVLFLALVINNAAAGQQRKEIRARDRVEWGREAQQFRRAVGFIWRRLEAQPFNLYSEASEYGGSFVDLVSNAGWPNCGGETADELERFSRECLPPAGHKSIMHEALRVTFRHAAQGRHRELITDWETAKDILEIWAIALDVGGSREPALREVIRGLKRNHLDSIRLMWFLSIAHTQQNPFAGTPDYAFVSRVREVMEGRE